MKSLFKFGILIWGIGCKPYAEVFPNPSSLLALDTSITISNPKINRLIEPYKQSLEAEMNEVIGYCPSFLEKKKPSSALGNFMADAVLAQAQLSYTNIDFCVLNYGGIRGTLDSGDITIGDVYEIMPFENEIIILNISKNILDSITNVIRAKNGEPFSRELLSLPAKEYYTVATSDYVANGGDNYTFFANIKERTNTQQKIRDALIAHILLYPNITLDFSPRQL